MSGKPSPFTSDTKTMPLLAPGPGRAVVVRVFAGTVAEIHLQWEYIDREFNVQDSDKILLVEEFLNEVGKDGWELVSVATTPTENFTHLIYLKRQNLVENLRR